MPIHHESKDQRTNTQDRFRHPQEMGLPKEILASAIFLGICVLWSLYFFARPSIPMVSEAGVWGTPWYVYALSASITGVFVSLAVLCGKVGYAGLPF